MRGSTGAESKGLWGEPGLVYGLKKEQEQLLHDAVLERRRTGGCEEGAELTLGEGGGVRRVGGARGLDEGGEAVAEAEAGIQDGVAEREEGGKRGGRDGGARQVGAGLVGVRLLVGEHPQLKAREERSEWLRRRRGGRGGGGGGGGAEGGYPDGGGDCHRVVAEELRRVQGVPAPATNAAADASACGGGGVGDKLVPPRGSGWVVVGRGDGG